MHKKIRTAAGILTWIVCMLLGCAKNEKHKEELLLLPVQEAGEQTAPGDSIREQEKVTEPGSAKAQEQAEGSSESVKGQEQTEGSSGSAGEGRAAESCVVHICGAVKNPGVYLLEEGSRLYQAVEKAGGFREDADEDYLNQADRLLDGMQVYVPTKEETEEAGGRWQKMDAGPDALKEQKEDELININTAAKELLCTLPGVGESRALSIIDYRSSRGAFQKIEDIMNVEGIKDGLFQKIKDRITV